MAGKLSSEGRRKKLLLSGCLALVIQALFFPQSTRAETLQQALITAYHNNPALRAERARLRAVDEGVPQALSGWRPNVVISSDAGKVRTHTSPSSGGKNRSPYGAQISLVQPLFRGFRTINSTRRAEADVKAGRQALLSVEQTTLLDTVVAYMDVLRDQSVVKLQKKNVVVLNQQLKAERVRYKVGEVTRTDVAQSRARLAGAISTLTQAKADLASSRAVYGRVVGNRPGSLSYPPSLGKLLPKTLDQAITIGKNANPEILTANFAELSARHSVDEVQGELYPDVSLEASYNYRRNSSSALSRVEVFSVIGRVNIPLYQSGSVYSRIRQAKQSASQRRLLVLDAERTVVATVISSWEQLQAQRAQINSDRVQVRANRMALQGVRQEAQVGSRTTLDVLDAEQELLNSNVTLVRSRRNKIVTSYRLLASIGKLTVGSLRLPVKNYNPSANYNRVRNKLIGTSIERSLHTK